MPEDDPFEMAATAIGLSLPPSAEPRRIVAHGFTFVGWAMEYESELPANDPKAVWNEAMNRSHTEETQLLETRQRLLRVHEVGERCLFCDIASGKTGKVPEAAEENSGLG